MLEWLFQTNVMIKVSSKIEYTPIQYIVSWFMIPFLLIFQQHAEKAESISVLDYIKGKCF